MKRGKRFFENDNLLIYAGTAIFFVLAISIGIIMYMTSKTNTKISVQENNEISNNTTKSVTTDIGKTVEDQTQNNTINNNTVSQNTTTENITTPKNKTNTSKKNTNTTTNTTSNTTSNTTENTSTKETKTNTTETKTVEGKKEEPKKEITFAKPTEGEIICEFAKDNLIYSETLKEWITHTAIDIKADKTSVVKSASAGVVKSIVNDPRYGLTVVIEHDDGYETVYSNLLTAEFVVEGEKVEQGQTIGTVGNTSSFESSMECHLHFELIKDGEYLDPKIYLK